MLEKCVQEYFSDLLEPEILLLLNFFYWKKK